MIRVNTLDELPEAAKNVLNLCPNQKKFAIYGEMGAGKTTLVKAMAKILGATDEVASPTFSLINEYAGKEPIYHIDLYRLNSLQEALDIGIEDYLYSSHYCFIEWPGLIESLLPHETVRLEITTGEAGERLISVACN